MIYPLKKPKTAYTIQAIIQTLLFFVIYYTIHQYYGTAKILLLIAMAARAFGSAFLVIPTVINLSNSDPIKDSFALSLWFIFTCLGDVVGIILIDWMLEAGISWNYAFIIFMMIFLLTALLQHFFIEEKEEVGRNRN